jgi:hypothetical protein
MLRWLRAFQIGASKSRALYPVSSDVEGAKIAAGAVTQVNHTIVGLQSAHEVLTTDLRLMATALQSTIAGVKRQLLESDIPEAGFEVMQHDLVLVVRSYVQVCVGRYGLSREALYQYIRQGGGTRVVA